MLGIFFFFFFHETERGNQIRTATWYAKNISVWSSQFFFSVVNSRNRQFNTLSAKFVDSALIKCQEPGAQSSNVNHRIHEIRLTDAQRVGQVKWTRMMNFYCWGFELMVLIGRKKKKKSTNRWWTTYRRKTNFFSAHRFFCTPMHSTIVNSVDF